VVNNDETPMRRMDIHLLSHECDEGSPFGVEYTTRRLTLADSGEVTCDDAGDGLWQVLAAGIAGHTAGRVVSPTDGEQFLDTIPEFFRYHFLSSLTPLVYDRRGVARPDHFRIDWRPTARLGWGHGYQFLCERSDDRDAEDALQGLMPVAGIDGWGFFHEFGGWDPPTSVPEPSAARIVTVGVLPQEDPAWAASVFESDSGPRETRKFVRAFLRRFFERQSAGLRLDLKPGVFRQGRFAWRGGF